MFPDSSVGKASACNAGDPSSIPGLGRSHSSILGLPLWLSWQRIHLQCRRHGFNPWVGKIPWRKERLPTPVFWPGEFHGVDSPWSSPGWNIAMISLSLLQGIFPNQGPNPCLLHCKWILYQLSHKGSPRILEWLAYFFSSGSSWPRNQTGVSCIAGEFFTNWVIREANNH